MVAVEPEVRIGDAGRRGRRRRADEGVRAGALPALLRRGQPASAVRYVAEADPMLLADGTYFLLEAGGELVGCGGWSRRDQLYTGSGEPPETAACSIPRRSRPGARDVRPSRLDAARARPPHPRGVRGGRAARGLPPARVAGDASRRAALPRVWIRAARGGRRPPPRRRPLACVAMEKPITD